MQPIEFPQQNEVLAKDQPQYTPLPVHIKFEQHRMSDGKAVDVPMEMTACFQLSPEEIAEINATGKLWYTQCVFGNPFQPVRLSTKNPFQMAVPRQEISPIAMLISALKNDPDYRETWKANLAMAFYDAYGKAESNAAADEVDFNPNIAMIANEAADNFLNMLCTQAEN